MLRRQITSSVLRWSLAQSKKDSLPCRLLSVKRKSLLFSLLCALGLYRRGSPREHYRLGLIPAQLWSFINMITNIFRFKDNVLVLRWMAFDFIIETRPAKNSVERVSAIKSQSSTRTIKIFKVLGVDLYQSSTSSKIIVVDFNQTSVSFVFI